MHCLRALLLSIGICLTALAASVDDTLINYWRLDEARGDVIADSSLIRNPPGKVFNGEWVEGVSGSAIYFSSQASYAETPVPGSIYDVEGITIDFHFKPAAIDGVRYVLTSNGAPQFFVRLADNLLQIGVSHDHWREMQYDGIIKAGQWYHLVVAIGDGAAECYVDGQAIGSIQLTGIKLTNIVPLTIGRSFWDKENKECFNGTIDEIRIYSRKLQPGQILKTDPEQERRRELRSKVMELEKHSLRRELVVGKPGSGHFRALYDQIRDNPESETLACEIASQERGLEEPALVLPEYLKTFAIPPTSSIRVLPETDLSSLGLDANHALSIIAAPGEYESVRLAVNSSKPLGGFSFAAEFPQLPGSAVDHKYLIYWKQDGGAWTRKKVPGYTSSFFLTELLVHDPDFINRRFDLEEPLHTDDGKAVMPVRDSESLGAMALEADFNQQIIVTVHVPRDQAPGLYPGRLKLYDGNDAIAEIPIDLRVLPIKLVTPKTRYDSTRDMVYSIYYWGNPSDREVVELNGLPRTDRQFAAEMRDIAANGITSPVFIWEDETFYNRPDLIAKGLRMAREAGMCRQDIYFGMSGNTDARTDEELAALRAKVKKSMEEFRALGITGDVYWYGRDEQRGTDLSDQIPAIRAIQDAGAKVLVSGFSDAFDHLGGALDICIRYGIPQRDEAAQWHQAGGKIWCYAAPQAGTDDPAVYRRNFGILLWMADYDGCADYCYIDPFKINPYFRGWGFVYPTVDGVVRTLSWDGFREGVDDVRYLTTLKLLAESSDCPAAREALEFLDGIDPKSDDTEYVRLKAMRYILDITSQLP